MSTKILYFYVDTNLFIQCLPLEQINWSNWSHFEILKLMVSRSVQREIDDQKYRGNSRVGKRARSTYSLFRQMVTDNNTTKVVQTDNPRVELYLEAPSNPDPELSEELDFSKPDDNIIGCMSTFIKSNPDADVRLLTNDAGPMMTAQSISLPFEPISQDWLIEPENTAHEREIARLNKEISILKSQEPVIEITCREFPDNIKSRIELQSSYFSPLGDAIVNKMMNEIKSRCPMVTNFDTDSKRSQRTPIGLGFSMPTYTYSPPTKEAINRYQFEEYPEWLDLCKTILKNIHNIEQRLNLPAITVVINNVGTRPANDALCVFESRGDLQILSPSIQEDIDDMKEMTRIPTPPQVPSGNWRSIPDMISGAIAGAPLQIPNLGGTQFFDDDFPARRDPNSFYYKEGRSKKPVDTYELECEQWRHNSGEFEFEVLLNVDNFNQLTRGAIEIQVHAENLSSPIIKTLPVTIEVNQVSLEDTVQKMIYNL